MAWLPVCGVFFACMVVFLWRIPAFPFSSLFLWQPASLISLRWFGSSGCAHIFCSHRIFLIYLRTLISFPQKRISCLENVKILDLECLLIVQKQVDNLCSEMLLSLLSWFQGLFINFSSHFKDTFVVSPSPEDFISIRWGWEKTNCQQESSLANAFVHIVRWLEYMFTPFIWLEYQVQAFLRRREFYFRAPRSPCFRGCFFFISDGTWFSIPNTSSFGIAEGKKITSLLGPKKLPEIIPEDRSVLKTTSGLNRQFSNLWCR